MSMHILMGFNTKVLIPELTTIYSLLKNNDNVVLHIVYSDLA
jgi:lipopolysaccharide biosynthesis glycosyltransferase